MDRREPGIGECPRIGRVVSTHCDRRMRRKGGRYALCTDVKLSTNKVN